MDSKLINDPRSVDFERSPKFIKHLQSIYTSFFISDSKAQHKPNHLMPNFDSNHFNQIRLRSLVFLLLINCIQCNKHDTSIEFSLANFTNHLNNQTISFQKRSINDNWSLLSQADELNSDQLNESSNQDQQDSTDLSKSDQVDKLNSKFDQPQFDEPKQTRNVQKIPIGAIFTPKDKALRSSFIYAVKSHNRFESSRFQIEPIIDVIDTNDAFRFTRQLCLQLSRGIFALVTPVVGVSYETLISYSNTFHLPFLYAGSPLTKQTQATTVKHKQQQQLTKRQQQNPVYSNHKSMSQGNSDLIADYGLYLQPDIVHAIFKTMQYLKWDHFVYLYDTEEGLIKLQNILEIIHERLPSSNTKIDLQIVHRVYNEQDAYQFLRSYQNFRLRQASQNNLTPLPESAINYSNDTKSGDEGHDDLEDLLNIRTDQSPPIYVILNCEAELVAATIRKHIDDIYMNRRNFHYLIINLNIDDLAIYNLTNFGGLNITGFRLLNKSSLNFRQFISYWKSLDPVLWPGAGSKNIETGASLVFDAARLLFESFERLLKDQKTENFNQNHNLSITNPGINCAQVSPLKPWPYGKKIFQQLRKTTMQGLTGHLAFGSDSKRTNYTIEIIQTTMNSELTKIAEYHYTKPSVSYSQYDKHRSKSYAKSFDNLDKNESLDKNDKLDDQIDDRFVEEDYFGKLTIVPANFQRITNKDSTLENKTYIITSILEEPFLMIKKPEPGKPEPTGNDRYIGYSKDLTELIAEQLNINYELRLVSDGKYGARTPAGGFNGMVGELIRKEADMAIAPLTITSAREKVIQFSKPFLSLGISIMIKKPEKSKEGSFSFMNPLSQDIWIFILLSYSLVSVVLYLVSKCSPSEIRKVLSANPSRRGHYHKKNSIPQIQNQATENYLDDLVNEYGQHYLHYPQLSVQSNPQSNAQSNPQSNQQLTNNIQTNALANTNVIYTNNQFDYQLNNRHSFNENNHSTSNLPTSTSNETYFENEVISPSTTFNLENLDEVDTDGVDKNDQEEILYLNEFNLVNSAWFALGAVLQQGVDVCPRSYSGRIVGSVWWFFTLIIISSYTANLAAFLTVERMVTPINSADDLAKQTEVEYGVLKDSSTQEFFRNSQVQVYRRMWEFMSSRPNVFVDTYAEGIKRVRESKGKFAFLMESTQAEYINEKMPCDTMKVGRNLDAKGFGIATSLYSSLHVKLNLAVLSLTEKGDLTRLENKWWYDSSECKGTSNNIDVKEMQTSLTIDNVEGIFYILIGGLCCSLITAIIDLTCRCYKESVRDKVPFCSALWRNLKISFAGKMVIVQKNQIYYTS